MPIDAAELSALLSLSTFGIPVANSNAQVPKQDYSPSFPKSFTTSTTTTSDTTPATALSTPLGYSESHDHYLHKRFSKQFEETVAKIREQIVVIESLRPACLTHVPTDELGRESQKDSLCSRKAIQEVALPVACSKLSKEPSPNLLALQLNCYCQFWSGDAFKEIINDCSLLGCPTQEDKNKVASLLTGYENLGTGECLDLVEFTKPGQVKNADLKKPPPTITVQLNLQTRPGFQIIATLDIPENTHARSPRPTDDPVLEKILEDIRNSETHLVGGGHGRHRGGGKKKSSAGNGRTEMLWGKGLLISTFVALALVTGF